MKKLQIFEKFRKISKIENLPYLSHFRGKTHETYTFGISVKIRFFQNLFLPLDLKASAVTMNFPEIDTVAV